MQTKTPASFTDEIKKQLKAARHSEANLRIALPESNDPRVLTAAVSLLLSKLCDGVVLFSTKEKLTALDQKLNLGLQKVWDKIIFADSIEDEITSSCKLWLKEKFSKKNKAIEESTLEEMSQSPLYQAGYLLANQKVSAVVAGSVYTTGEVIRAGIQTVGLSEGCKTVSGSFIMERDGQCLVFADSAVVVDPTVQQLVDIAQESVKLWQTSMQATHGEARVAFLSFSTKGSATHEAASKMQQAHQQFSKQFPKIKSDGELQFDAAFDVEIAKRKSPESPVAGQANIFIFPNLDAGNLSYKIAQRLGNFQAYGPVLQGLQSPYCDLSRGATSQDIETISYLMLLRAAQSK